MGFLTTITLHNDALHSFKKNPQEFAEAIFEGIDLAYRENKEVSVPFKGYCNYITVQKSRHADDETIYLHSGNGVTDLGAYSADFEYLAKNRPELAKEMLKKAKNLLKWSQERFDKIQKEKKS